MLGGCFASGELVLQAFGVFVSRLDVNAAEAAGDVVRGNVGSAEAASESGEAFAREAQSGGNAFFNFSEAAFAGLGGEGKNFLGLGAENGASGVDAVDADVVESAAAKLAFGADIAGGDLEGEQRVEIFQVSDFTGVSDFLHVEVGFFEMEAIGDHQLGFGVIGGLNHAAAIFSGDGHRLFANHVDAGLSGGDRIRAVHAVGKHDIESIDELAGKKLVKSFVAVGVLDFVPGGDFFELGGVAGDQGDDFGIFTGVGKGGQDGNLGEVSEADDGVSDLLRVAVNGGGSGGSGAVRWRAPGRISVPSCCFSAGFRARHGFLAPTIDLFVWPLVGFRRLVGGSRDARRGGVEGDELIRLL